MLLTSQLKASFKIDETNLIGRTRLLANLILREPNLTAFQTESQDVYNTLPGHFLDNYKSFCWYNKTNKPQLLCLPKLYLAGFPKCGSSDLFTKLIKHPKITAKSKEFQWWTIYRFFDQVKLSAFSSYLKNLGPESVEEDSVLIDASTTLSFFLWHWKERYPWLEDPPYYNQDIIYKITPAAKILMILRDPTERLWSDYLYFAENDVTSAEAFDVSVKIQVEKFTSCSERKHFKSCCFDHSITNGRKYVTLFLGVYICFVQDWKEKFGDQMMVVELEDYSNNPVLVLQDIFKFLEIHPLSAKDISEGPVANTRKDRDRDKGDMLPSTRKLLKEFYGTYNQELSNFLNDTRFLYD